MVGYNEKILLIYSFKFIKNNSELWFNVYFYKLN